MTNEQLKHEENRVGDAVAIYAAVPEFNQRIAEEFMGWKRQELGTIPGEDGPVTAWCWCDSKGTQVAGADWSPMTNADHAIEVMRSPRWRSNWPNTVLCFGPDPKSDIIVIWEKEGGGLQQLARAPRVPTAISLTAIRSLASAALSN